MDEKDRRAARIGALTGHQLDMLLSWLCGYVPHVVDAALDELGYGGPAAAPLLTSLDSEDWNDQAAAQATEAGHG